jgi:hypothetical protein
MSDQLVINGSQGIGAGFARRFQQQHHVGKARTIGSLALLEGTNPMFEEVKGPEVASAWADWKVMRTSTRRTCGATILGMKEMSNSGCRNESSARKTWSICQYLRLFFTPHGTGPRRSYFP